MPESASTFSPFLPDLASHCERAVLPFFVADYNQRPAREGCCVLVRLLGGFPFLVTASHVLSAKHERHVYVGHPGHRLIQLPRYRGFHTADIDDPLRLDIGLIPLTRTHLEALSGLQIIPEASVDSGPTQPYSTRRRHAVFGWPASRSQVHIDRPKRHIRQQSFTFFTGEAAPDIANQAGFDSATHLVLEFDPTEITVSGRRHTPPDPTGISGSAALRIDDDKKLHLAGIMTQRKKNPPVMVATRMSEVIKFAQRVVESERLQAEIYPIPTP